MTQIKKGDVVTIKSALVCKNIHTGVVGWNSYMGNVAANLQGKHVVVTGTGMCRYKIPTINFEGDGDYTWLADGFELVDNTTSELDKEQDEYRERTGYRKFQVGDIIERTRRFTPSFEEGEHHEVQRISGCGYYCWVGGHRHKVPMKYFKLIKSVDEKIDLKDIPVPTDDEVQEAPTLSTFGADNVFEPEVTTHQVSERFAPSIDVPLVEPDGRVAGDNPTGCGLVSRTEPKPVKEDYVLLDRRLVAGLLLDDVKIEYRMFGEWVDVDPSKLTVTSIGRLDFRLKPLKVDFYGNTLPTPVNVDVTDLKTVYGVSFNNRKTFPTAISTARTNKLKGYGCYFSTDEEAKLVLETLLKPLKGFI